MSSYNDNPSGGGKSTGSSTLQAAVSEARSSKALVAKGAFEARFAGGLDLSEFDTGGTTTGTATAAADVSNTGSNATTTFHATSHAANLLKIKQVESLQRLKSEQDDAELLDAIGRKSDLQIGDVSTSDVLQALPPPISQPSRDELATESCFASGSASAIGSLLVGMHGMERQAEPRHKLQPKNRTRQKAPTKTKSRKSNVNQDSKGKASVVKKHSRRSKH